MANIYRASLRSGPGTSNHNNIQMSNIGKIHPYRNNKNAESVNDALKLDDFLPSNFRVISDNNKTKTAKEREPGTPAELPNPFTGSLEKLPAYHNDGAKVVIFSETHKSCQNSRIQALLMAASMSLFTLISRALRSRAISMQRLETETVMLWWGAVVLGRPAPGLTPPLLMRYHLPVFKDVEGVWLYLNTVHLDGFHAEYVIFIISFSKNEPASEGPFGHALETSSKCNAFLAFYGGGALVP